MLCFILHFEKYHKKEPRRLCHSIAVLYTSKRARSFIRQPPARSERDVLLSAHQNLKKRCLSKLWCAIVSVRGRNSRFGVRKRSTHLSNKTYRNANEGNLQKRISVSMQPKNNHYLHILQEESCSVTL